MTSFVFGKLADGREVQAAALTWPNGLQVEIIEFGAAVHAITVPVRGGSVQAVVSHETLEGYQADTMHFGTIVGRCANRIADARFEIDGESFKVHANEGANCLHGGTPGFDKRLWRMESAGSESRKLALTYVSPDGEQGFPGRVELRVEYELTAPDTLVIAYEARCDRATPVNLSHHLYFNLSGDPSRDILDHQIRVGGGAITPVRPDLIPTGELMDVTDTPFDLRTPRRIGEALKSDNPQIALAQGYDHNWALDAANSPAVELSSPESGVALTIETDQVGLQIYSGQGIKAPFRRHGGIVFEPQGFPDAVNQPNFPNVVLRPGQVYRRRSSYRFTSA